MTPRLILAICFTLIAFAANSVLSRYALGSHHIDALSFTAIRLASGTGSLFLILIFLSAAKQKPATPLKNLKSLTDKSQAQKKFIPYSKNGFWLLLYALCFSFAYLSLSTATGALVLFGTVQLWMLCDSLIKGHRLSLREWIGFIIASLGFLLLTLPYATTPSLLGLLLMIVSGIAWACYTLNGKNSIEPIPDTAHNFLYATLLLIPCGLIIYLGFNPTMTISVNGVIAALLSGAFASGMGYALWYSVLPNINSTQASSLQLLVPLIAALSGLVFLQEALTLPLILSGLMLLGGIYLLIKQ